jgi:hypothetical protein
MADFKDKDVALSLLWIKDFYNIIHENIFLWFCILTLGLVRSLDDNFHLDIIKTIITACIHDCKQYSELFTCTNLTKWRIIIYSCVRFNSIIADIIRIHHLLMAWILLLLELRTCQGNCLTSIWIIELSEFMFKLWLCQSLNWSCNELIKLKIHI